MTVDSSIHRHGGPGHAFVQVRARRRRGHRQDHVRQAAPHRRVREAVRGHARRRGPPAGLPHEQGPHPVQRLGHGRPGEVRGAPRRVLHPGELRHTHVRRHQQGHLQKRAQLAQGSRQGVREHSYRPLREQGRHQGPQGQGQGHSLS